ncbi:MAG: TlpA family protein disulfide reductase [Lewinellaceae bacterium]|nr:TlpA family protein disulfide reductase [Saprospiraceae bacterium]MCB9313586.1 TlpA family protein disulfide reductase [Lewinellaceae bacterium]
MMIFLKKYGFWILAGGLLLALFGKYLYLKPRFVQGEEAPVFSGTLLNGSSFSLDDLAGDYILLDFWGSWCGPCRQANPTLVKIYREFARTASAGRPGFHLVSVGVESSQARWKQAIQQDRLEWPYHLTDTDMFNGEIARLYGVKQIPTTYLIDPDRKIIGVNLPEDRLRKVLQERLLTN